MHSVKFLLENIDINRIFFFATDFYIQQISATSVVERQNSGFVVCCLFVISVYRRYRLVITENSARIQDETTESSAWFFNVLGV